MTQQEQQQTKLLLIATSSYYGQKIPDDALALYLEDLDDLPFAAIAQAMKDIRRDPKTTRCPLPAVIRNRIQPEETDENIALDAVSRIIAAVSRYGWCNPSPAREFIGELGWRIVTMEGGWQTVCETLNYDNIGTLRAQWRQLAMSNIERARAGTLAIAPALPTPMLAEVTAFTKLLHTKLLQEMPK